jgi:peptidoglycan/LPS O-acetylase OafA/YrhL
MVMTEMIIFSLRFSAIALLIVFGALALISFIISLIKRADDSWQTRENSQAAAALEKEPSIDSLTLVLLTAAAATILQGRFYIKRVRRLMPATSAKGTWSLQGRAVLLGSHIIGKKR